MPSDQLTTIESVMQLGVQGGALGFVQLHASIHWIQIHCNRSCFWIESEEITCPVINENFLDKRNSSETSVKSIVVSSSPR